MIEKIFAIIKQNFEHIDGSTDLKIKCPYCGGSKRHPNKKSLYISKTPVEPYGTYVYHCFRAECGVTGTLYDLIRDLNLDRVLSKDELLFLLKNDHSFFKSFKKPKSYEFVDIEKYKTYDVNSNKLEYIKSRLGISEIPEFIRKTLVTTFSYLNENNVKNQNFQKVKQYLETSFIGFKTFDRCKIICRNTNKQSEFRYYNIYINNKVDYYITSPKLNNLKTLEPGKILIAEGIFSVLKGYYHLLNQRYIDTDNIVLVATLGGKKVTFLNAYQFAIHSLGIPDWEVYILSDSEIKKEHYSLIKESVYIPVTVLYNSKGEDFGTEECEIITTKI